MREIKFRGKAIDTGEACYEEWIYGYLYIENPKYCSNCCYIFNELGISSDGDEIDGLVEVDCASVGQYTGLQDKNGMEIYEGDIMVVRHLHDGDDDVWMNDAAIPFVIEWDDHYIGFNLAARVSRHPSDYEVIGNIYENPELLKGGAK